VIRIALIGSLVGLPACAPRTAAAPDKPRVATAQAGTPAIVLDRTPCFGGCPVYTVTVSGEGEVTYQGRAHVRRLGTATGRIPKERVDSLLRELEGAGYFAFADLYTPAEPTCGRYATDSPSAISRVTHRGRTKAITHDYGCGSAPWALTVLERRIDEALGSSEWTGR
jgi:hypothetical protein